MLQRKACENHQTLCEEEKQENPGYAHNRYRRLFIEMNSVKMKETESVSMHKICTKRKKIKSVKNTETFSKKKVSIYSRKIQKPI